MISTTTRGRIGLLAAAAAVTVAPAVVDASTDTTEPADTAGDEAPTASLPEFAGEPISVAVVLPSASNDLAFSQSMADALSALEAAGYVSDIQISENMFVIEDAATALRDYADDGADLVIGHGSQYGALIEEIAPDFPDTAFAWGTASDTFGLDNVSGYSAAADQGAYVMGRMAALLTESQQIGIIGPIEVGDGKLYAEGFQAGVASVDDAIDVQVNWTDSFSDVALAAEAATSFVGAGADVLTGSSQMTVGAIGVAREAGVLWFGTDANQTQLAPEVVVANQVYKWEVVLAELISGIADGDLGGESYAIELANGGEVIEFNEDYELPEDVRADADETIAALSDGSLETGVGEEATSGSTPEDTSADTATDATTAPSTTG